MNKNLLEIYYSYNVSEHQGHRIVRRYGPDAQIGLQLTGVRYHNDDVHLIEGMEIALVIENAPKFT